MFLFSLRFAAFGHDAEPDFSQIEQAGEGVVAVAGDQLAVAGIFRGEPGKGVVELAEGAFEKANRESVVAEVQGLHGLQGIFSAAKERTVRMPESVSSAISEFFAS